MRAVLNETLRLFPPVPANTRAASNAPVLIPTSTTSNWGNAVDMRPYYIPSLAPISYFPMLIHKRKDLWGPDADEFDPNRWLNDGTGRLEKMVKNPLMFVPFNAGPRIVRGVIWSMLPTLIRDTVFGTTIRPERSFILPREASSEL